VTEPDDTPTRLIAAAEQLFVEIGAEATSLRAVARAAHANAAAVHYHFGGRDELLVAVLERHLGPLPARREALLDRAVEAAGGSPPVATLLTALLAPDLELLAKLRKRRVELARFLGRAQSLPAGPVADWARRGYERTAALALPHLRASLPAVAETDLTERLRLVLANVAYLYATASERDSPGPFGTNDADEQLSRFVAYAAGGLSAPSRSSAPSPPQTGQKGKKRPRTGAVVVAG
jgi:AcrR family transcriptional regulator